MEDHSNHDPAHRLAQDARHIVRFAQRFAQLVVPAPARTARSPEVQVVVCHHHARRRQSSFASLSRTSLAAHRSPRRALTSTVRFAQLVQLAVETRCRKYALRRAVEFTKLVGLALFVCDAEACMAKQRPDIRFAWAPIAERSTWRAQRT